MNKQSESESEMILFDHNTYTVVYHWSYYYRSQGWLLSRSVNDCQSVNLADNIITRTPPYMHNQELLGTTQKILLGNQGC